MRVGTTKGGEWEGYSISMQALVRTAGASALGWLEREVAVAAVSDMLDVGAAATQASLSLFYTLCPLWLENKSALGPRQLPVSVTKTL